MIKTKKYIPIITICTLALLAAVFVALGMNTELETSFFTVETKMPGAKARVVFISDLHSCAYGEGQSELLEAIDAQQPDAVLLGGDIIDDVLEPENALILIKAVSEKYPCFYVSGNHEYYSRDIEGIKRSVREAGAVVLEGDCETLELGGQLISICGVDDPAYIGMEEFTRQLASADEAADDESFKILISHRPELLELYDDYGFKLVLAGHAHGGQWRLPWGISGLLAPNQGFFPEYSSGEYRSEGCLMIVGRGLAKESTAVPRIYNRPELLVIDLIGE